MTICILYTPLLNFEHIGLASLSFASPKSEEKENTKIVEVSMIFYNYIQWDSINMILEKTLPNMNLALPNTKV